MYRLTNSSKILRLSDMALLPQDERNADYQEYQNWIAHGNTPEPPEPDPVIVPQSVARRQGLQALLLRGYLDQVPAIIDAIPGPTQRELARIEFDESLYFERYRPMVLYVGSKLDLDSAGLDELFIFAATL